MSKVNDVTRIMSETLDRYRNSIPRKAFVRAMERVIEEALGQTDIKAGEAAPGVAIIKNPDITVERLADLLSGACPPFAESAGFASCDETSCRDCWASWLATGKPAE